VKPEEKDQKILKKLIDDVILNKTRFKNLKSEEHSGKCTKDFQGAIILSFQSEEEKEKMLENYRKQGFCWKYFGCCHKQKEKLIIKFDSNNEEYPLFTRSAPEPADIIWTGLNWTESQRTIKRYWATFIVIFVMFLGCIPIIFLMLWADGLVTSRYQDLSIKALGFWKFLKVKAM